MNVRQHIVLSVFLAASVAALAMHQSITGIGSKIAPASARKLPEKTPPAQTPSHASTRHDRPHLARYSDAASPADRRRLIVDQLRAMGVPNDVLALVALEDFEVEWDSRFDACRGDSAKMERVQLAKDMGKDDAMRAALGEAGFKQWDTKTMLWEAMSTAVDATPAESDSIYALKKKLQQRQFELEQAQMNGTMDRAHGLDAVRESYDEYNRELKAVLGDERYAKSQQLDDGFMSDNLRYELAKVNPSDAQFQQLFKVEKDWNKSFAQLDQSAPDYLDKFKALNSARDQAYAEVLGSDALHTLREQEDSSYVQMKKYETHWGLDDTKIDYVYNTMNQYRKAVGDYQSQVQAMQHQGQNVDWTAVNNTLQQLASQTQQALQTTVGPDSFTRLQRNGVLRWAAAGFRPVYGATVPHP